MDHPQTDETSPSATTRRLRLLIAYDGRAIQGWQSQAHRETVQDRLEAAFSILSGGLRIAVHGSGRTDAGVHARGQVAHANVPAAWRHDAAQSRIALNAHLPQTIRIMQARFVPETFHARFSARGKMYRYRIWNDPVFDPFEIGRAWHFPSKIDDELLRQAAQRLVGRHDFVAFSANRGEPVTSTVRTIRRIIVRRRGPLLALDFEGDGFLYKMVRLLTGSLVRCAQKRATIQWLDELLTGTAGKTSFAAPAEGLCLMRVLYGRATTKESTGSPMPRSAKTPPTSTNQPARS